MSREGLSANGRRSRSGPAGAARPGEGAGGAVRGRGPGTQPERAPGAVAAASARVVGAGAAAGLAARVRAEPRAEHFAGAGALEELVRTVSALDGERAAALLSGLAESLRPAALGLLRHIERTSRADRHAALASTFAPRHPAGLPGAEVHGQLERWARRVALELERS